MDENNKNKINRNKKKTNQQREELRQVEAKLRMGAVATAEAGAKTQSLQSAIDELDAQVWGGGGIMGNNNIMWGGQNTQLLGVLQPISITPPP